MASRGVEESRSRADDVETASRGSLVASPQSSVISSVPLSSPSRPPLVPLCPPSPTSVELFGVPRLLIGARTVSAAGSTLGELAADLVRRQPVLAGRVLDADTGWPLDGYSFVVDERFTRDRALTLRPHSTVLLVASAAGGEMTW